MYNKDNIEIDFSNDNFLVFKTKNSDNEVAGTYIISDKNCGNSIIAKFNNNKFLKTLSLKFRLVSTIKISDIDNLLDALHINNRTAFCINNTRSSDNNIINIQDFTNRTIRFQIYNEMTLMEKINEGLTVKKMLNNFLSNNEIFFLYILDCNFLFDNNFLNLKALPGLLSDEYLNNLNLNNYSQIVKIIKNNDIGYIYLLNSILNNNSAANRKQNNYVFEFIKQISDEIHIYLDTASIVNKDENNDL